MNLESLTHTSGEWLRGSGPESDIVISSRIRLARNLAAFPFSGRASAMQKAEIEKILRQRISALNEQAKLNYLSLANLSAWGSAWDKQARNRSKLASLISCSPRTRE